nr:helix-turn-helix transcriptional regulator [Mycobacterium sp. IS-2888]
MLTVITPSPRPISPNGGFFRAGWTVAARRVRRTRNAVGLSPLQLVQRVRLERSLHLLRTTRMPLEEIAAAVGLADPATLHRLVKKHTGRSPGALRPSAQARAS